MSVHQDGAIDKRKLFETFESEVRGYCRSFPVVFAEAKNARLTDESGREYIDFLAGAGSLNYGHNDDFLKDALLNYVIRNGVTHGLDMMTTAKHRFIRALQEIILKPREMDYKIQFTGPTGTNAVEAAFKIARNTTGRTNIISFTNGFHGVTLGAVAATGNSHFREAAGVDAQYTTFMPYDGYLGEDIDTLTYFEKMLVDKSSGLDKPAAVIVETIQGEGGVNEASYDWLRRLERLCNEHDIVFIVDDIQVGCGRTGTFFSFEDAGINPDIVTLSKSLSGFGLPMSVVLIKPRLDQWRPGEHNGTFRGNNLAFITAAEAIERYWRDRNFSTEVRRKSWAAGKFLHRLRETYPGILGVRGRGLIFGMECSPPELANAISAEAFKRGVIVETSGADSQVVKLLPPLTIEMETLQRGLHVLEDSLIAALQAFPQFADRLKEVSA
jgi:diaminobutyrate-2-oxoglutarate transaminase